MIHAFHPFTTQHFVSVALGLVVVAGFLLIGKKGGATQKRATTLLAVLNFSSFPLSLLAWYLLDTPVVLTNALPLQLCDVATLTAGFALLSGRPLLCALTYFWGLAATLQALVTPALTVGFPHMAFVMFFVQHFAIVAAALYLPIVIGWRPLQPRWKAPLEIAFWSVVYLLVAMSINKLLGTNFGFVSHPPENPSLIDHLGPWPYYLASMLGVALTLYYVLLIPFVRRS